MVAPALGSVGLCCDQTHLRFSARERNRPQDKPFFLWLAALDPHRPYHENIIPNGTDPAKVRLAPYHLDTPEVRKDYALYYDEIRRLDKYVGLVMTELAAQKVEKETMVVFMSDNGRPFPRDKTSIYDSGIKTPFIVRWPAKVASGVETKSLVSALDLAPTFLKMAHLEVGKSFQGKSFLPILMDPKVKIRDVVIAEQNWHDYEAHSRAVRNEDFKYIRNSYPDLPLTPSADGVRSPTFQAMIKLHAEGNLSGVQSVYFVNPRPKEELYHASIDIHETKNL
ncbi:sulfatase-like hydrolase/transferase, partial [Akkermansiaceae bacterium]|nr:sulfatase-like hydrolase/transferase [Akkermansiaceae bacterium]